MPHNVLNTPIQIVGCPINDVITYLHQLFHHFEILLIKFFRIFSTLSSHKTIQSTLQSTSQSTLQSTSQSTLQSTSQSTLQSTLLPTSQSTLQSTSAVMEPSTATDAPFRWQWENIDKQKGHHPSSAVESSSLSSTPLATPSSIPNHPPVPHSYVSQFPSARIDGTVIPSTSQSTSQSSAPVAGYGGRPGDHPLWYRTQGNGEITLAGPTPLSSSLGPRHSSISGSNSSSIIHHPSSIIHHPSSVIRNRDSDGRGESDDEYHRQFSIDQLRQSMISSTANPSSVIHHPSSSTQSSTYGSILLDALALNPVEHLMIQPSSTSSTSSTLSPTSSTVQYGVDDGDFSRLKVSRILGATSTNQNTQNNHSNHPSSTIHHPSSMNDRIVLFPHSTSVVASALTSGRHLNGGWHHPSSIHDLSSTTSSNSQHQSVYHPSSNHLHSSTPSSITAQLTPLSHLLSVRPSVTIDNGVIHRPSLDDESRLKSEKSRPYSYDFTENGSYYDRPGSSLAGPGSSLAGPGSQSAAFQSSSQAFDASSLQDISTFYRSKPPRQPVTQTIHHPSSIIRHPSSTTHPPSSSSSSYPSELNNNDINQSNENLFLDTRSMDNNYKFSDSYYQSSSIIHHPSSTRQSSYDHYIDGDGSSVDNSKYNSDSSKNNFDSSKNNTDSFKNNTDSSKNNADSSKNYPPPILPVSSLSPSRRAMVLSLSSEDRDRLVHIMHERKQVGDWRGSALDILFEEKGLMMR